MKGHMLKYMQFVRKVNPENSEKHCKVAKTATRSSIEGFNWEE